jgi:hypothetical protein
MLLGLAFNFLALVFDWKGTGGLNSRKNRGTKQSVRTSLSNGQESQGTSAKDHGKLPHPSPILSIKKKKKLIDDHPSLLSLLISLARNRQAPKTRRSAVGRRT